MKDTVQIIAHIAISISAIIAMLTYISNSIRNRKLERRKKIEEWQRIVVYKIIRYNKNANFKFIKSRYLEEAQIIKSIHLPKDEIQNDTLRKILLELVADNLILEDKRGIFLYRQVGISHADKVKMVEDVMKNSRHKTIQYQNTRPKIIKYIEENPGNTAEKIFLEVKKEYEELEQELANDIIAILRTEGIIKKDGNNKFFPTIDFDEGIY